MYYRRANVPGATYFFTVNLADRKSRLLVENIDLLKASIRQIKIAHPFKIDAIVVLPDHLHAMWALPQGDADFATRWALIKAGFSRRLPKDERISESRRSKGERGIWQRRYWEHLVRDDDDFARHIDYIHFNPVKHGYVERVVDWPHSSFHRFVRDGVVPSNWASEGNFDGDWGERR
jgi:putative transposase